MKRQNFNNIILIIVLVVISAIFISMIRNFLMVILLAGITSALAQPLFRRFERLFRGRKNLSAVATLLFILLIFLLPLAGLLGIVAGQAIKISEAVQPWIVEKSNDPDFFASLPLYETISPYKDVILEKSGELVGNLSSFFFESLSSLTLSTVNFLFLFFIFLYTLFFFIKEGDVILEKILYYLPLTDLDERRLLEKFTSVTRATIKGTLLIGVLQGGLAGAAFWVVGIEGALFWGTVMTVLSIIPAVGSALVWFPAAVILAASGRIAAAVGLWIFCGLLVGSVDNILRPRLVGKDTQMHELLILFSTLGGLSLFGIVGFIIGPIIAALFVTVWTIYGETFKKYLPEVGSKTVAHPAGGGEEEQEDPEVPAE